MKKTLYIIICIILLTNNTYFSFAENTCKEEIIENATNPTYSPDGTHFAYSVNINGKYYIIKDGIKSEEYDGINKIAFSPNSKSFIYSARKNGKNFVVVNGIKGEEFDESKDGIITKYIFSTDGKSFSYIVSNLVGKYIEVKDGIKIENGGQVENPIINQYGKSFIYKKTENGKTYLEIDGVKGEKYDYINNIIYSPDGKGFAYEGGNSRKISVIINGIKGEEFDEIDDAKYSPDGKSFAYEGVKEGKRYIIKDGVKLGNFLYSSNLIFSNNGDNYAYIAYKDGKNVIVKNGTIIGEETDDIYSLTFSPNGENIAYNVKTVKNCKEYIVKNGEKSDEYDCIAGPTDIIFSPDSKSFAYMINKKGKSYIMKDGIILDKYGESFNINYSQTNYVYETKKDGKNFIIKNTCGISNTNKQENNISTNINTNKTSQITNYTKQLIITKGILNKTQKGKSQIKLIDEMIEKQDNDKLKIILKNILTIKAKMNVKTKYKYKDILDYIEASIGSKTQNEISNKTDIKTVTSDSKNSSTNNNSKNDINESIIRDETRKTDLMALKGTVEMYYQDNGIYPNKENFSNDISVYIKSIPKDPLGNIIKNGCKFGYYYEVGNDSNGIKNQAYRLSCCLENESLTTKDNNKFETGILGQTYKDGIYIK
ncbi:MAG: hypothetical protein PHN31_03710 [Candidatus Gracilibacteria bacterium]|nr:hypothetical protein [Candidatus Gracilibacteria bacterium]